MYICVCQQLNEEHFRRLFEKNPEISMKYIKENVVANCCLCLPEIKRIRKEVCMKNKYVVDFEIDEDGEIIRVSDKEYKRVQMELNENN